MQKKLIAVAVAGMLGAPAVALAQTSTVNIYGRITYEYGWLDSGRGFPDSDYADNPGGSAIGFRGEEKLGGGLSAWFQCETSADVRGMDQVGLCSRNSAVGFKGGFGNIHFGRWDTPMKRALAPGSVGGMVETGLLGTSFVAWGGSGGTSAMGNTITPPATTGQTPNPNPTNRDRWKRREVGLIYYESPIFGGFQVLGAFSPGNDQIENGGLGMTNDESRVLSLAGTYKAGPLGIGLAYEKHKQFGALGAARNFDDKAWGISAGYTFANRIEVGATYLDTKYNTDVGQTLKRKSWTVGVEWNVAGPHTVLAFYGNAGDSKGNSLAGVGMLAPSGPDTGADDFSIGYRYNFSKRTWLQGGYHRTSNDRNGRYRNGNAAGVTTGEDQSAWAFHVSHSF